MKDIVLLFDTACIYEIVILNYFLKYTKAEIVFCSLNGKCITSMEGYSINVDTKLSEIDLCNVRSVIVPGGNVTDIRCDEVYQFLRNVKENGRVVAGICAGVDVLDKAGILQNIKSTHSVDLDVVRDNHIITARANGYVDFAIEVGKELELFENESDLQETIEFWKYHKSIG